MSQHPPWSYSQSRAQTFDECLRKYYYHYYASHSGWKKDATDAQRTAYRLKQMTNLYLVFGEAVHQMCESVIRQYLKGHEAPRIEYVQHVIRQLLRKAYEESHQIERWIASPKHNTMLSELYYDGEIPPERRDSIRTRLAACTQNFFQSKTWQDMTHQPRSKVREIEKWDTFQLHETNVYVKMDMLYTIGEDQWIIVDWKTGNEDQFDDQLLLYAMYVHETYEVPLSQIRCRVEYLSSGTSRELQPSADQLTRLSAKIEHDLQEMKTCLMDPALNIPRPITFFTPSPRPGRCKGCHFREICEAHSLPPSSSHTQPLGESI
ncbi:PD-(D/E)XK nuclease family protein [Marinicrinis sediminis]|uniref:PD-(D/E)XK nuclease family protein n=1 Tax=Marinicrinis sediminis TaxID=1652465 RepID=A0ABW5R4R7_9BACL